MFRGYVSDGAAPSDCGLCVGEVFGVLRGEDGFLFGLWGLLYFEEVLFARLVREEIEYLFSR